MNVRITPSDTGGKIKAISSKSIAHRILICAAFANESTRVVCEEINDDIWATVRCLCALGAKIERRADSFFVEPVKKLNVGTTLDCGESGSTLRFLLPVACILGADASFLMSGRLPERPLSPLFEELQRCGVALSPQGSNPLVCKGKITECNFSVSGNVSSQFISGLLFALCISGCSGTLTINGPLESAPYVDITADTLRSFGARLQKTANGYTVSQGKLTSPREAFVEGDWSGAAFPLCLGAIGKRPVSVYNLNSRSYQGDREIVELLRRFGANVSIEADTVTVSHSSLHGIDVDASQIPDLVPVIATLASVAEGKTVIRGAARLRIKESDRLSAISNVLSSLGARISETPDGLEIEGVRYLAGGRVSAFGDHRIAMSAAVASAVCERAVIIDGAHAVAKSYPAFWDDARALGLDVKEIQNT